MKIKYTKKQQYFGDFQASRVISIRTLKGELLIKADILDRDGKLLYKVLEPPESDHYDISYHALTIEELFRIADLLRESDLEKNWDEELDFEDEEDLAFVLGSFGESVAIRHSLRRESKKTEDVIVEYLFDSSKSPADEEYSQTDYFKSDTTEEYLIENYLLPKLLEREGLDAIRVNIAKAGVVNSYLVTLQE